MKLVGSEESQLKGVGGNHSGRDRRNHRLVGSTMALFVVPCLVGLIVQGTRHAYAYLAGDIYYYLGVAKNVDRYGWFTYDGEYPVNGFHPLWQLCVVGVYKAGRALGLSVVELPDLLFVVSLCIIAVAIWILARALIDVYGDLPLLFLFLPVGIYGLLTFWLGLKFGTLWSFADGMESGLVILAYALLVWLMTRPRCLETVGSALLLGLCASFLCLARLDHALFTVPLFLGLAIEGLVRRDGKRFSLTVLAGFPVLLAMLGYMAVNKEYYGSVLPVSGIMKSSFPRISQTNWDAFATGSGLTDHIFRAGVSQRAAQAIIPMLFAVAALSRSGMRLWKRQYAPMDRVLTITAVFVLLLGSYNVLFVGWLEQGDWYYPVSILFVTLFTMELFARSSCGRNTRSSAERWAVVGMVLVIALFFIRGFWFPRDPGQYRVFLVDELPRFEQHYEDRDIRLIEHDDGIMCYATDFPVISATLLMADPVLACRWRDAHEPFLDIAYSRGFRYYTTWAWRCIWLSLDSDSSSEAIEDVLRANAPFFFSGVPEPCPYRFAVDYLSPTHFMGVIRIERRMPSLADGAPTL